MLLLLSFYDLMLLTCLKLLYVIIADSDWLAFIKVSDFFFKLLQSSMNYFITDYYIKSIK